MTKNLEQRMLETPVSILDVYATQVAGQYDDGAELIEQESELRTLEDVQEFKLHRMDSKTLTILHLMEDCGSSILDALVTDLGDVSLNAWEFGRALEEELSKERAKDRLAFLDHDETVLVVQEIISSFVEQAYAIVQADMPIRALGREKVAAAIQNTMNEISKVSTLFL